MLRFLAGALVGAGLLWLVSPEVAPAVAEPPRPAVASAAPAPTGLEGALAQARRTGRAVPFTLVYTEQQLTAAAANGLPRSSDGVSLSDPRVRLVPGVVVFTASAQWGFLSGQLVANAVLDVRAGKAVAAVTSASIGGVALPDQIGRSIAAELQRQLDTAMPANVTVTAIAVTSGTVTAQALASP